MGACATKPGDLKVKGEAPLVVEDAAAVPVVVAGEEKAKADGVVPAAAEADPADASRRRSLSDLLKQDAATSDGEADQEAGKVVAVEPEGDDAGATTVAQAPVQASAATEQQDDAAGELKDDPHGDVQAEDEEEKRVDPDSVQVVVPPPAAGAADAAAPSAEGSKVADDASA